MHGFRKGVPALQPYTPKFKERKDRIQGKKKEWNSREKNIFKPAEGEARLLSYIDGLSKPGNIKNICVWVILCLQFDGKTEGLTFAVG